MPEVSAPPAPPAAAAISEAAALGGKPSAPSKPGSNMDAAFADMERKASPLSAEPGKTIPKHPNQNKTAPEEKPLEKPAKSEEKPLEKEVKPVEEKPKLDTKPVDPPKPKKPSDFLREELSKVKEERNTFKAEIEKLKTAPKEHPELKAREEKIAALEKRNAELEEEFKFTNYERSPEYKTKWEQPFIDTYQSGRSKVSALKVTDPASGEVRPGKPEDFDSIMQAPSDESAAEMIETMFGAGARAQIVTMAREKVLEANSARNKAVDEFRKNGSEREKQFAEFHSKITKEISSTWEQTTKPDAVPEKHKAFILPKGSDETGKPIDAEGDAALDAGYKSFDRAAGEDARDPKLTPEQRQAIIGRAAAIRHRAAAYPRLVKWLAQRDSQISELQEALKAYQTSEPGEGNGKRGEGEQMAAPGNAMDSVMAQLEKRGKPIFH